MNLVTDDAGEGVDGGGILPAWELHDQAVGLAAVELSGALHWCSQAQPLASGSDGGMVMHLGLDGDVMWSTK
jgi:hypothetical protein